MSEPEREGMKYLVIDESTGDFLDYWHADEADAHINEERVYSILDSKWRDSNVIPSVDEVKEALESGDDFAVYRTVKVSPYKEFFGSKRALAKTINERAVVLKGDPHPDLKEYARLYDKFGGSSPQSLSPNLDK